MSNYSILRIGPIFDLGVDDNSGGGCGSSNKSMNGISSSTAAVLLRDAILCHFRRNSAHLLVLGTGGGEVAQSATSTNKTNITTADKDDDDDSRNNFNSSITSRDNNILSISNRYFDAQVILLGLDEPINNNSNNSKRNEPQFAQQQNGNDIDEASIESLSTYHREDGVILIFNDDDHLSTSKNSSTTTFDSLDRIHSNIVTPRRTINSNNKHTTMVEGVGDLLRLCIGTTSTTTTKKITEEEYSRRILWCLDHGYEYIQVDLSQSDWQTIGFNERDKDGYARVIEAIETCMWSCHVMKTTTETKTKMAVDEEKLDNEQEQEEEEEAVGDQLTSTLLNDTEREKAAVASLMNGILHNDNDNPTSSKEGSVNLRNHRPQHQQQPQVPPSRRHDEELAFHQLEQLLSEAKSIREASTSNSMSDEERRERAVDTALKLMDLLEHLGLDEEEDDDEDDQNDST
ncbi:hypothetical protein ACHAWU_008927 [Discostella pseudostelligera]|uniref:Uncharacterized protein n=1 Tax=Discostella pseudostelligera TaxID=259834 RepID=A0ABD3M296_9STRA